MSERKKQSYLLLSRSDEWYRQLSDHELQKLIADNQTWVGRLLADGKARPGVALAREGATVFGNRRVVVDGPFAESKEAIGGTLILEVSSLDEAIEIARACPSLRHDSAIEIRPMRNECPLEALARERQQHTAAAAA